MCVKLWLNCPPKSRVGCSRSVNGQVCAAGDEPNGHVPLFFFTITGVAEDFTSVAVREMQRSSKVSCIVDIISATDPLDRIVVHSGMPSACSLAPQSVSLWLVMM